MSGIPSTHPPIEELIGAFLDSADDFKDRITDLEMAIDRQGIKRMKPGQLVDRDFCREEHKELIDELAQTNDHSNKNVNAKIYASWVVLVFALSYFGMAIKEHGQLIHDLMKEVFK